MRDEKPSLTAWGVAIRRAAHQLVDRPLVFEDPLAVRIAGPIPANRLWRRALARRLQAFVAVRSRIAEDTLGELVGAGITQYVILGAGLDTFGYRNPYPGLRVFEVDHPATQAWKRRRLEMGGIATRPGPTLVPVNFERQNLGEELARAGFRADAGAFFSWLGVTLYLEEASVWATLRYVAEATRAGGGIVFDYAVPPSSMSLIGRLGIWMMASRVRAAGEPWRSYFDPAALAAGLEDLGFSGIEDLDGPVLNRRYFAGRTDGLRVAGFGHIMRAFGGSVP